MAGSEIPAGSEDLRCRIRARIRARLRQTRSYAASPEGRAEAAATLARYGITR